MTERANFLTDADVAEVRRLLRESHIMRSSMREGKKSTDMLWTPETYVAYTPEGGIPSFSTETGTGSPDVLGSAECDIFRVGTDGILESTSVRKTVHNISSTEVAGNEYVIITRDKGGAWFVVESGGGDGGTGTATYIAVAPSGGIPAPDNICDTGTGSISGVLSGVPVECNIYKIIGASIMLVEGLSKLVYNLGPDDIPTCAIFPVTQDAYGDWVTSWWNVDIAFSQGSTTPSIAGESISGITAIRSAPDTGLAGGYVSGNETRLDLYCKPFGLNQWGVMDTVAWQIVPESKVISGDFHVRDGLATAYDHTDTTQKRVIITANTDCYVKVCNSTTYALLDDEPRMDLYLSSTKSMQFYIDSFNNTAYVLARCGEFGGTPFQQINFIQFGQNSIIIEVGSEDGELQLQLLAAGDGGTSVCSLVNASAGGTAYKCAGNTGINHATPGMLSSLGLDVTGGLVTAEGGATDGAAFATAMGFGDITSADQGTAVADATGAGDVVAQLNALLASLRTAGIIAT